MISVGSHEEPDPLAFFYNPAPPVEFFARGVDVEVAWLGGGKIRSTGNSFATPHMSGICALILGKHPELTPFQLKSVLHLTANNVARRGDERRPAGSGRGGRRSAREERHRALLQSIVEVARAIFGAQASSIFLLDEDADELVFEAVAGEGADDADRPALPVEHGHRRLGARRRGSRSSSRTLDERPALRARGAPRRPATCRRA